MNIKKSRLAATLTVMLVVCMMVTMFVIPVSAATIEAKYYAVNCDYSSVASALFRSEKADLHGYASYDDLVASLGLSNGSTTLLVSLDGNTVFLIEWFYNSLIAKYNDVYSDTPISNSLLSVYFNENGTSSYYAVNAPGIVEPCDEIDGTLYFNTSGKVVDSLGTSSLSGVLDQIVDLLPVIIVVMVGFIALRKGISFIQNTLHSA